MYKQIYKIWTFEAYEVYHGYDWQIVAKKGLANGALNNYKLLFKRDAVVKGRTICVLQNTIYDKFPFAHIIELLVTAIYSLYIFSSCYS